MISKNVYTINNLFQFLPPPAACLKDVSDTFAFAGRVIAIARQSEHITSTFYNCASIR